MSFDDTPGASINVTQLEQIASPMNKSPGNSLAFLFSPAAPGAHFSLETSPRSRSVATLERDGPAEKNGGAGARGRTAARVLFFCVSEARDAELLFLNKQPAAQMALSTPGAGGVTNCAPKEIPGRESKTRKGEKSERDGGPARSGKKWWRHAAQRSINGPFSLAGRAFSSVFPLAVCPISSTCI